MTATGPARRRRAGAAWLLVLVAAAATFHPLARGADFEVDDYRYLDQLRQAREDPGALWGAMVVENRWDQDWWIPDGTFVRFFRPFVILSYGLDRVIWGQDAGGFVLTNLLLHLAAALLAWGCFRRLLGSGAAALIAALAFTTQACHLENLDYVAGRTDTLAGLAFFGTLLVHLRTRERGRPGGQLAVAGLYFLALLGKEFTVLLPALIFLLDRWLPPTGRSRTGLLAQLRAGRWLYGGCVAALAAYLLLRHLALGEGGSGVRPFPYFFLPGREGFATRTAAVGIQYCAGLALGAPVQPFLSGFEELGRRVAWPVLAAGTAAATALVGWGLAAARGRWLALVLATTLLPLLPLYSTSRYLYLTSFAWSALVGLAAGRLLAGGSAARRVGAPALLAVLVVAPAVALHLSLAGHLSLREGGATRASAVRVLNLFRGPAAAFRQDRPVFVVDLPFEWIEIQFLQATLQAGLGRDLPPVRVLAKAPARPGQGPASVRILDRRSLLLERQGGPVHDPRPGMDFDPRPVRPGDRIREEGYEIEVLAAGSGQATAVRVHFDRDLADLDLFRCVPQEPKGWELVRIGP